MDNYNYYPDGVDRLIALLRDEFRDYFKIYYNGDPLVIPEMMMPCLIVSQANGTVRVDGTGTDRVTENIGIKIVLNKKDDFGALEDSNMSEFKVRKLIIGQSQNGEYAKPSVMRVLRKHISLSDAVVGHSEDIELAPNVRPNSDDPNSDAYTETITQEGIITATLERIIVVNQRD